MKWLPSGPKGIQQPHYNEQKLILFNLFHLRSLEISSRHGDEISNRFYKPGSFFLWHGNQALVRQVSFIAPGFFAGELFEKFTDARDFIDMLFFHIKKQRTGNRI